MKNVDVKKDGKVEEKSLIREIFDWVFCIVTAFVLALIIKYFIFTPTLVMQTSMTPTIQNMERVLINRVVRTFHLPIFRGDIITFEKPSYTENGLAVYYEKKGAIPFFIYHVLEAGKISYIKRVIGVAGDHVVIEDGEVYVNDMKLEEPYLQDSVKTPTKGPYYDVVVPEGYLFVMGDNRTGSTDSRMLGCIPLNKVEGRVTYRIWPLTAFGKIDK